MNSNNQGRRPGKSVSFRGQSNDNNIFESRSRNDSNSYDNRQRNSYREQKNFEGSNQSYQDYTESRTVTLLPDANMTISVQNDFRGSGRGRSKGSRGILKAHGFRDDTCIPNRSSEFGNRFDGDNRYSDHDNFYSNRGFESLPYQNNRNRRGRGYHNRNFPKFQDNDCDNIQHHDVPRGRSKSAGDRPRRGRGGRGRGRGRQNNRSYENQVDDHTSGDGDKEDFKEQSNEIKNDVDEPVQSTEIQNSDFSESNETHVDLDNKDIEVPVENEVKSDEIINNDCELKSETTESMDNNITSEDKEIKASEESTENAEETVSPA